MDKAQVKQLIQDVFDFAEKEVPLIPGVGGLAKSALDHIEAWLLEDGTFDRLYDYVAAKVAARG